MNRRTCSRYSRAVNAAAQAVALEDRAEVLTLAGWVRLGSGVWHRRLVPERTYSEAAALREHLRDAGVAR